ncbi:MAG: ABC transporter permease subunit [Saprospiraceae bacterium]
MQYLLKRLLVFIPTLIIISLVTFFLSKVAPGDPVMLKFSGLETVNSGGMRSYEKEQQLYRETATELGLDKPPFYFALTSAAYPDTLYRFLKQEQRETLEKLIAQYGNWTQIESYHQQIKQLEKQLLLVPDSLRNATYKKANAATQQLYLAYKNEPIQAQLGKINQVLSEEQNSELSKLLAVDIQQLRGRYDAILNQQNRTALYIPALNWHGFDNQYHHWFTNFLMGDFGISYNDSRPVVDKIMEAVKWTLIMNFLAIFFAYGIAIPLGVFSAARKGTRFDRVNTVVLFALYSLPGFWIATILVVFFTSPQYGEWLDIFPAGGLGNLRGDAPFGDRFLETAYHLILPVFCMTYGALAFISRQMRGGMLDVLQQDYIRTARAKGLSEKKVVWKHALRNSLFPIITLFANVFPAALAGSVIIEFIFNIPGMGRLVYDAILTRNWPVVYSILMLSAILTMVGILVADLLYAASDPRVSLTKNSKK